MIKRAVKVVPEYYDFCTDTDTHTEHINVLHERLQKVTNTVNSLMERLGVVQNDFPDAKDLPKLKYNRRMKDLQERIIKNNENDKKFITLYLPVGAPESERLHDVEIEFLSEKGYCVRERIDANQNYYCKISWN